MRYDMLVIGAGPAGEKAATQAAYFGRRVAVVDRREAPGGSVVGSAGIPTKTLRETALYLTGFRRREPYGVGMALMPDVALERLKSRTAEVTQGMTEVVRQNLRRNGVELVHLGQAVMHAGGTIDQFIHTTFNVPTRTEAYKYAAYDGRQRLAR